MPIFLYKGYDAASGAPKKGKIEADSPKSARQKLRTKEQIIVSDLKEEITMVKTKAGQKDNTSFFKKQSVGLSELSVMTRQFATLQNAQVPLDECLKALTQQVESVVLRNTLSAVKDSISEGKSLADALGAFPTVFNRLYVNMVRAGEQSGNLGLVLERLADFQEYQVTVQGKIFSSMSYPAIMMTVSGGIILYLFISIVPKIQKIFDKLRVELPWYTKSLIQFSEFLQNRWYILVALLVGGGFLFRIWYRSDKGRLAVDRFSLNAPIFGPVVLRINVSKFTKTLSTLLSSGVPIIMALEITKNIIGNRIISDVVENAKIAVQEGESLAATIERGKEFPPLVSHMIRTGEKTGELEQMLKHVAQAYDAEVERKIDAMISLIEPLMIVFMGGVVAVVVIAMLVPMLSVMNQMH
jgi:general secretion pathway protein F